MNDLQLLYNEILEARKCDAELSLLCDGAAEYARLHLYARKVTGCNSLGEIENLYDEFRRMIFEIMRYCGKKNYIDSSAVYSLEITDKELVELGAELGEFL
jgi:hypothetical protein